MPNCVFNLYPRPRRLTKKITIKIKTQSSRAVHSVAPPSVCLPVSRLATTGGSGQDARAVPAYQMIEATEIETKLLDFLKREVFAPEVAVTPETDLLAAGFDSMSLVRVLLFLEQTYGFWIPEGEITGDALQNVRTLATTAARLLNAR